MADPEEEDTLSQVHTILTRWANLSGVRQDNMLRERILGLSRELNWRIPRVVVIGSEGAGKSTLVNAILGDAAAPTGAYRPSTAIPLVFGQMADDQVGGWYLLDRDGKFECRTAAQARPAVIQSISATTAAAGDRARMAFIGHGSPMLNAGVIVDFPGMEGASAGYASYDEYLGDSASGGPIGLLDGGFVVVVGRGRNYGPVKRLIAALSEKAVAVNAVVINVSLDDLHQGAAESAIEIEAYKSSLMEACEWTMEDPLRPTIHVVNLKHLTREGDLPWLKDGDPLCEEHGILVRSICESLDGGSRERFFCSFMEKVTNLLLNIAQSIESETDKVSKVYINIQIDRKINLDTSISKETRNRLLGVIHSLSLQFKEVAKLAFPVRSCIEEFGLGISIEPRRSSAAHVD